MKKLWISILIGFLVIGGAFEVVKWTPKAHAAFGFSKSITVQTGKVPSTQSSFPMLVSGTYAGVGSDPDLRTTGNGGSVISANGYDVGFYTNANCSTGKMNWETELYTASTGKVSYWVNVSSISDGTIIYLCYGDASITTDQSNATAVWDSNFTGVWHLSDNAANTTVADSVTSGHNGANTTNTSVVSATGQIAKGLDGHVGGDWTSMGNVLNSSWAASTNFTLSIWLKASSFPAGKNGLITKTGNAIPGPLFGVRFGGLYYEGYDGTNNPFMFGATSLSTGTWYYAVFTRVTGTTTGTMYLNAVSDGTVTDNTGDMGSASDNLAVGNSTNNGVVFDGILDEARVSNIARSANWITTEYNNQSSPSTFYAFANNAQGSSTPTIKVLIKAPVVIKNSTTIKY